MKQSTHKALVIPRKHASALQITTLPTPSVADHHVLVRVTSVAINPVDWKLFQGVVDFFSEYPAVLGNDGAGTIEAIGSEVTMLAVGDKVFFQTEMGNSDSAAFQEYALIHERFTARIPNTITEEEAASIPVSSLAAFIGLHHSSGLHIPPFWAESPPLDVPKAILIGGGSSNVGQWAIQFAKLSGFKTIITTASRKHLDMLHKLGATHIIDRNLSIGNQRTAILQINSTLTMAFDAVSTGETQALLYSCLDDTQPTIKLVLTLSPEEAVLRMSQTAKDTIGSIIGFGYMHPDIGIAFWQVVPRLLAERVLVCAPLKIVGSGLDAIQDAMDECQRGVSGVKLIVNI